MIVVIYPATPGRYFAGSRFPVFCLGYGKPGLRVPGHLNVNAILFVSPLAYVVCLLAGRRNSQRLIDNRILLWLYTRAYFLLQ